MNLRPNLYFARSVPVDLVARGIEEVLAGEGYYLLMDDDQTPVTRLIYVAQISESWIGVWDPLAPPSRDWPEGDPATSLSRGLSEAADATVLYLFSYETLWGYYLLRRGVVLDRFATDPRRLLLDDETRFEDVDGMFRGDLDAIAPLLQPDRTQEELAGALAPGDDSLLAFLEMLGLPPSVTLNQAGLSSVEKELMLALPFAPRV